MDRLMPNDELLFVSPNRKHAIKLFDPVESRMLYVQAKFAVLEKSESGEGWGTNSSPSVPLADYGSTSVSWSPDGKVAALHVSFYPLHPILLYRIDGQFALIPIFGGAIYKINWTSPKSFKLEAEWEKRFRFANFSGKEFHLGELRWNPFGQLDSMYEEHRTHKPLLPLDEVEDRK